MIMVVSDGDGELLIFSHQVSSLHDPLCAYRWTRPAVTSASIGEQPTTFCCHVN